ncbi:hypothetical protein LEP1GSC203_1057 [Leptospira terpstrae serovar Hualin str. LT 11-33 = ATCC 700639]|uniref:Uncharacterized protein n=1 Tax=Leptospira terpstrae serovar Hualin str. LT 11-33 = ATCC 700639 TaxID=1257025 RepID=N1VSH9_9LEPT|nr:hypothetical protein LEP1GSC203_1057 [Leptospira terpstrae serovar Hualin str. LT 11-33 = ATCC 700639]
MIEYFFQKLEENICSDWVVVIRRFAKDCFVPHVPEESEILSETFFRYQQ